MGLDGGTYITRSDVLRGQSWKLATADTSRSTRGGDASTSTVHNTADPKDIKRIRWSTCLLSNQPLQDPIVADYLGNLYNRDAVLEFLLARSGAFVDDLAQHRYINQQRVSKFGYEHLKSSRDIFTVHLSGSSDKAGAEGPISADVDCSGHFVCPITNLSCMHYPFVAISKCGHVFSDRALKQVTDSCCPVCNSKFTAASLIPINGTSEQVKVLTEALASCPWKGLAKGKRKRERS